jgi:hypothetical protein
LNNNNVNSYSQVSILAMGLQRGNSNEMEQRVGEPDRVIEEIQVFHRRSQLWGTQCCKPGIMKFTWCNMIEAGNTQMALYSRDP